MGLLSRATSGIATPEQWLVDWFKGGQQSSAGVTVNTTEALGSSAFFAGVRVISEDVGSLPLILYLQQERGKQRAKDHPLYPILKEAANPLMTAMQLRETLTGHVLTWGDGFAYVDRRDGFVESVWPLRPDRMVTKVDRDSLGRPTVEHAYDDPENGIRVRLPRDRVFRVSGLGFDGIRGYSLVAMHRNAIGLSLAMEEYGSRFFANGSRPSGVLKHPRTVSPEARDRIKNDWERLHQGLDNAQRVAILEEGVEWQQVGLPMEDTQFLEGRKFQVTEMARILRVPPHKLADLERATFSNIEDQGIDYLTSSLRTWLIRWEQAISLRLLTQGERERGLFAEHIVEDLLRGDIKTRYDAYATGRQWGWLNGDDIAEKENMDPLPDGQGTAYLVPLNMQPAPVAGQQPVDSDDDDDDEEPRGLPATRNRRSAEGRRRIASSFEDLFADADLRLAKMERSEVERLVKKHLDSRSVSTFEQAVTELFEELEPRHAERFKPIMDTLMRDVAAEAADEIGGDVDDLSDRLAAFVAVYNRDHVGYHVASARQAILNELVADDPAQAVRDHLDRTVDERPARTARKQTVQLQNATSYTVWQSSGVRTMRWQTFGDNCPYCTSMAGMTQSTGEPFLPAGGKLQPEGTYQLKPAANILHPPLHDGCDCTLVPS